MGLIKNIKQIIKTAKINQRINRAKIVHIMFNDKFNKPFVDFLNKNFNQKEHLVLCKRIFDQFPFPDGENVIEIKTLKNLNFDKVEKIICHSLFDNELVDYMFNHQNMLKQKVYWVMWGGDLYGAPRDEKNDFVRKNFRGYIACIAGDEVIAKEKYGSDAKLYSAPYTVPITSEMINNAMNNISSKDYIRVQINNSCDKSILDAINLLSKYKDENVKISATLSYGDIKYKEEIIQKGRELFGDKFEYVEKYLSPDNYAKYLANTDIIFMYQDRQQGLGNITAASYMGKKIFIKSEISTFKYLSGLGIKIYDSHSVNDMEFKDFVDYPEEIKDNNIKICSKFYENDYLKKAWEEVF